jgi:isocitrate dehydrogenase
MNDYKEELGIELEKDEMEEIKNEPLTKEQLDELEKLHYIEKKELNNNILIINEPMWYYDDSFMENSDKELLLRFLKDRLFLSKPWADKVLQQIIIRKEYADIVMAMNIEQYKQEKNNPINSFLSMLE